MSSIALATEEVGSGEIFIAQGEPASPGYAVQKTLLALKARKNRRSCMCMVETRCLICPVTHPASYALSALGRFFNRKPRVRRLTLGYKYAAPESLRGKRCAAKSVSSRGRGKATLRDDPICVHPCSSAVRLFSVRVHSWFLFAALRLCGRFCSCPFVAIRG